MGLRFPIRTKVRGVTFDNDDGSNRQEVIRRCCRQGTPLAAIRDPDNPHGDTAIGLWAEHRGRPVQVGWISSELAERLAPHMDEVDQVDVVVLEVTGGGDKTMGLNVELRDPTPAGDKLRARLERSIDRLVKPRRKAASGRSCSCTGVGCILILAAPILALVFSPNVVRSVRVDRPAAAPAPVEDEAVPPPEPQLGPTVPEPAADKQAELKERIRRERQRTIELRRERSKRKS